MTANYTDPQGQGKTVSATTSSTVGESPNQAPAFAGTLVQLEVDENTPANTPIGEPVTATDPDEGDVLNYSLTGADDSKFSIDPNSGQLRTELDLDYESSATHSVTVVAKDDAITPLMDEIGVTINVNNLDEPGRITVLPENPPRNQELTATLTDPDGAPTGVTWQWAERASTTSSRWADIAGATSNTHTPLTAGVYLRVTAEYTDPQGGGKTTVKEIPLSVTNTPPTFDDSAPTTASVAENNQGQATVGSPITGSDPNGDPLTYGLRDTNTNPNSGHAASFSISGIGQITVALGVRLDHEAQETYLVTVDLSDGRNDSGGTDNSTDASRPIIITVTDANDPGTVTISNSYPQNGLAITASLVDQDLPLQTITWKWARGISQDGDFTDITGATRASYTPQQADLGKYLRASVSYTDNTAAGQQAMAVTDTPVDEQIALDKDSYTFYTFENSIADAPVIGDLPEASNTNGTVVYSLNGGDARRYNINSDNGGITVRENAQLDYEADPPDLSHSMTIDVTDDSGARDTAQVTINIKDLMEDERDQVPGDQRPWHHHLDENSRDPVPHGPRPRRSPQAGIRAERPTRPLLQGRRPGRRSSA